MNHFQFIKYLFSLTIALLLSLHHFKEVLHYVTIAKKFFLLEFYFYSNLIT